MKKIFLCLLAALSVTAAQAQTIDWAGFFTITPGQAMAPEPGFYVDAKTNETNCCTIQYTVVQNATGDAQFLFNFPVEKLTKQILYTYLTSATVTDSAGNILPGWTFVPEVGNGPSSATWTYSALPAGTYTVTLHLTGYYIQISTGTRYNISGRTYWLLHAD